MRSIEVSVCTTLPRHAKIALKNRLGGKVDDVRARELLAAERRRVEHLLQEELEAGQQDRSTANESGDIADPAERLTAEQGDDAVTAGLRDRLGAIERAEARLREGVYGRSVKSGLRIPDERLEADPAAELTVEEASQG
jgi:DnaK suppressor protein